MLLAKSNIITMLAFASLSAASIPARPHSPNARPERTIFPPPRNLGEFWEKDICPTHPSELSSALALQRLPGTVVIPFPRAQPQDAQSIKDYALHFGMEYGLTRIFPDFETYYLDIYLDVCTSDERRLFNDALLLAVVGTVEGQILFWFSSTPWDRLNEHFRRILRKAENTEGVTMLRGIHWRNIEYIDGSMDSQLEPVNVPSSKARCYNCEQSLGNCHACSGPMRYTSTSTPY